MSKIAIVGAGRLGTALSKLLVLTSDHELVLIDTDDTALATAFSRCAMIQRPEHRIAFSPTIAVDILQLESADFLADAIRSVRPEIVVCAGPADVVYRTAEIACQLGCHYLDFNVDLNVAAAVRRLSVEQNQTFVPQVGLTPGLISYIGLGLIDQLEEAPASLDLRVGVLPQVAFGPSNFALTSKVEDLVDAYTYPCSIKTHGQVGCVTPLDGHETLMLNGVSYEAFYAGGGFDDFACFESIPSVSYKVVRPMGHLKFLQDLLSICDNDTTATAAFKTSFNSTRDDYVLFIGQATDVNGFSVSSGLVFYPNLDLDISADELCNVGTACGIIELMIAEKLDSGILTPKQIPIDELLQTQGVQLIFYQSE